MKEPEIKALQEWFDDIRSRHPFAKMSKEEILEILRTTREVVSAERALQNFAKEDSKE